MHLTTFYPRLIQECVADGGGEDPRLLLHHEAMENGANGKNCTQIYGGERNSCGALQDVAGFLVTPGLGGGG